MKNRGFETVVFPHAKFTEYPTLPKRGSKHSAGWDFFLMEDVIIPAGETVITWTDIKSYMQPDEVLKIYIRSSLGVKKKLMIANGTGVVDSDYYSNPDNDGNIMVALYNYGRNDIVLLKGDRVAQGIFEKYLVADGDETTEERTGGVGSTGK